MSEQISRCNWCNQELNEDATWFFCCDKIHCSQECANCTFQLESSNSPSVPSAVLSSSPLVHSDYIASRENVVPLPECDHEGLVNAVINFLIEGWGALNWSESGEVY